MNFEYMPELSWRWGYFMVLGIIGFVILVLVWRFWASGWFSWGRRKMTWAKPFMVEGKKIQGYITSDIPGYLTSNIPRYLSSNIRSRLSKKNTGNTANEKNTTGENNGK
jgi:hypothetical protein